MTEVFAFVLSGAVVVAAAMALAKYADAIAEGTGFGRLWIGSVLLAGATSLPELATDVSAVRIGAVDVAVGDLFGSSLANMLILAVVDLASPDGRVLRKAAFDHVLAASLAIALNSLAAVFVLLRPEASLLSIGPGSFVLFAAYVLGARVVYRHAARGTRTLAAAAEAAAEAAPAGAPVPAPAPVPVRRAVVRFSLAAVVVLATAPFFAWSAKGLAEITGLGNTFVGTLLVGLATSLPELVACFAAVRLGSFDLAVGTLFGSNAFNMAIFFVLDAVQPGSLFANVDQGHAISGLFAVVLMALGIGAIVYRAERRFSPLEPTSFAMLGGYLLAMLLLYLHTNPP